MKFWNFQEKNKNEPVELRIDGDIVDDDDTWIYEWLGMPCASPNAFRNDLAQFEGRDISVWIDSYGGSVFAAVSIFNALMKCKNTGATIVTNIDGKAMSAATTIFMAGDKRNMSPGSMFMMHNPLMGIDSGYASDFRKYADVLDTIKKGIMNAYQLATGLDTKTISNFMDNETYMDAETAVKNKFATDILFMGEKPTLSTAINFSRMPVLNAANVSINEFLKVVKQKNKSEKQKQEEPKMEIRNSEELRASYPDLVDQLIQDAVNQERGRITALQDMDNVNNAAVHIIVRNAVSSGASADSIKIVVDQIKKAVPANSKNEAATNAMKEIINDNKKSGVEGIAPNGGTPEDDERNKKNTDIKNFADIISAKCGRAK